MERLKFQAFTSFILGLAVAIGGTFLPTRHSLGADIAPIASKSAAAPPMLKDVRFEWKDQRLILYASFNQTSHDLPIYLEWRLMDNAMNPKSQGQNASKLTRRVEIDFIEQFARDMPIAITVASLEKNAAGRSVLYIGQPHSNTPSIEGADSLYLLGRIVIEASDQDEQYPFFIRSRSPAAPGSQTPSITVGRQLPVPF